MPSLYVEIVAPDHSVFKGEASIVRAPGVQGSFEVLYNHAPMIAAFDVGPLYLTMTSGERVVFATSGGFVEVLENAVTVLAETAEPASEIDVDRASIEHDTDIGLDDVAQVAYLPESAHAHLADDNLRIGVGLEDGEWDTDLVVLVFQRRVDCQVTGKDGSEHVLGRCLAAGARDRHDGVGMQVPPCCCASSGTLV